jgi:hypothetical protein
VIIKGILVASTLALGLTACGAREQRPSHKITGTDSDLNPANPADEDEGAQAGNPIPTDPGQSGENQNGENQNGENQNGENQNGGEVGSSEGTAYVHIEAACSCAAAPDVCSVMTWYDISILDRETRAVIWGPETHPVIVMHNECSFTKVLGKKVKIPEAILGRKASTMLFSLRNEVDNQVVPFYPPFHHGMGGGGGLKAPPVLRVQLVLPELKDLRALKVRAVSRVRRGPMVKKVRQALKVLKELSDPLVL